MALLAMPLIAATEPPVTVWGIHPVSFVIPVAYGFGLRLLSRIQDDPLWKPVQTDETREEISEPESGEDAASDRSLWMRFLLYAGITAASGYIISEASIGIVDKTALSETAVGTIFAAVANSLPELVTSIAAVRIGAVSLALGDIIGGNAFEVMFLGAADMFYDGSIYEAMSEQDRTTGLIAMLMTAVLLLGMIRRQKAGLGNIGFESALVLLLYAGSVVLIFL